MNKISNMQKLEKRDPNLVEILRGVDTQGLSLCETRNKKENITDSRYEKNKYFHSNYNPSIEAKKWVDSIDLDNISVVFVYGLGLGYCYDELQQWLKDKEHYLVFLEHDLSAIKLFLSSQRAGKILDDNAVFIRYLGANEEELVQCCKDSLDYFITLPFKVTSLPMYEKDHIRQYSMIQKHIAFHGVHINYAAQESLTHGLSYFQNFYRNWASLREVYSSGEISQEFSNIPAIICGAGPSLNKHLSLLKKLKNKALFFAGGSAITALSKESIQTHFSAIVDPNKWLYERFFDQSHFNTPLYFKMRVFHKVLKLVSSPKRMIGGSSVYPVTSWMENELGLGSLPRVNEGLSISHFLMDVAQQLGCSPIIFVGMDLAYTNNCRYAKNVLPKYQTRRTDEQLTRGHSVNSGGIFKTSLYGDSVITLWKWIEEAKHISEYTQQYPDKTFINATEGGLGIEGIQHAPLGEVVKQYMNMNYDLLSTAHLSFQSQERVVLSKEKVRETLERLHKSLLSSFELCNEISQLIENLLSEVKKQRVGRETALIKRIQEKDEVLAKELAYQQVIEPVGRVRTRVSFREITRSSTGLGTEIQKKIARWESTQKQVLFDRDTAGTNILCLKEALTQL
ncbi:MAG: DUF115 domain-containing protein [Chlamydiales bacterium]|nr:DUF115 domain-containing protein [Chlamydiales bacterium]